VIKVVDGDTIWVDNGGMAEAQEHGAQRPVGHEACAHDEQEAREHDVQEACESGAQPRQEGQGGALMPAQESAPAVAFPGRAR
jgi:hypothetical protein